MDKSQLINSVIIAVIALLAKEVILWLLAVIRPKIKKTIPILIPTTINCLNKYWKIFVDIVLLLIFAFITRDLLSSAEPLSRSNIFTISFAAAWLVYWLTQLQADVIEQLKER